jgi:hypothetical protein
VAARHGREWSEDERGGARLPFSFVDDEVLLVGNSLLGLTDVRPLKALPRHADVR